MVLRPHSPVALVCGLLNVCAAFVPSNTAGGMGLIPIAASAPCRPAAVSTTGSGSHPDHRRHMAVTMASSVAPAPRTKAEKTSEQFKLKDGGMVEFGSGQRVEASISGAPLESMLEYISEPSRIVYACWEHKDITDMGDGVFRMAFRGQSFLSISIDMSVDIQLWTAEDGTIQCKSVGYSVDDMAKLLGQEFVDTFFLELEGELRVEETVTKVRALSLKNTRLSGDVAVTIGGKMPGLLSATPEPLVKSAALGINNKVLEYVSNTFVSTVAGDYRKWSRDQKLAK
ncbi:unnamed protein product [Ectocarpus sp. 8 AP-2014]